ncbi:hypothetical protein PHET_04683 [Paragonimus heterotremus]|uniref:C2H2-type domain-containing protein n=1 Tax=Paragonimus heterotremus TaxID=100268 RepID=A0A8J4WH47_9TREM|nr:hypothetical protein PHET_04683 [Paragonimus heterotremus]
MWSTATVFVYSSLILEQRSHACEFCGKNFSQNGSLRLHVDTVHLKHRSHACEFCGKNFSQNGNLRLHVDTVHLSKYCVAFHILANQH